MVDVRRQFNLPEYDLEYLERRGLPWETVLDGSVRWVVLHEHRLPDGYNHRAVSAALQLSPSYPETQIDMVYFLAQLALTNGKAIQQLSNQNFDGKTWQRWSRHRTDANPWRRGYDCVETHVLLVDEWLEREVRVAA